MFSVFFFTTLYLQQVLGYTPIKTGLSFLIVPFAVALTATNVPKIIQKVGFRPILIVSPLIVGSGLFWLSHIPVAGTFWGNVAPGLILLGLGMGGTFVAATIAATSGVPHHEAGLASGLLNTAQQVGGALGLAVLVGIATSASANFISNLHAMPTKHDILTANVHGFHQGYLVAVGFTITASLIAALVIRQKKGTVAKFDPADMLGA
jgi:MFS family permease